MTQPQSPLPVLLDIMTFSGRYSSHPGAPAAPSPLQSLSLLRRRIIKRETTDNVYL